MMSEKDSTKSQNIKQIIKNLENHFADVELWFHEIKSGQWSWESVAQITCTLYDMPKWAEKNIEGEDLEGLKTYMDELKKTIKALKDNDDG